jgi:hypothetical protein
VWFNSVKECLEHEDLYAQIKRIYDLYYGYNIILAKKLFLELAEENIFKNFPLWISSDDQLKRMKDGKLGYLNYYNFLRTHLNDTGILLKFFNLLFEDDEDILKP